MSRYKQPVKWLIWVLFISIILSASCGRKTEETDVAAEVPLNDVITQTNNSIAEVKSFSFSAKGTLLDISTGEIAEFVDVGAVDVPDSFRMKTTWSHTLEGQWQSREIIVVSRTMYIKYDDHDWTSGQWSEKSLQPPEPTENLKLLNNLQKLPDEVVNGVVCFHFKGTIDLEEHTKEEVLMVMEIWIGKSDSLPRRVSLLMQFLKEPKSVFAGGRVLIGEIREFYDYNQRVDIEAPLQ